MQQIESQLELEAVSPTLRQERDKRDDRCLIQHEISRTKKTLASYPVPGGDSLNTRCDRLETRV